MTESNATTSPADPGAPGVPDVSPTTTGTGSAAVEHPPTPPIRFTTPGDATSSERWLWRGLLLVLCLLAYASSFSTDFIWDDERHAANWSLKTTEGLERIWTKVGLENGGTPQYYPLTHTAFWIQTKAFGHNAVGYRMVNVLLHVGCAVLIWELLRRLRVPGAYLAAALFALHPVMVETVAWTSEQKNTLSLLLGLTSLLLYWMFVESGDKHRTPAVTTEAGSPLEATPESTGKWLPDWNFYVLSLIAFAAGMLSKTMVGAIPVILLLGLWWKRRLTWQHVGLVLPMLVAGLGMGFFTGYVEHKYVIRPPGSADETFSTYLSAKFAGTLSAGPEFDLTAIQRLLLATVTPWFYLWKLVLPVNLIFFYPRWDLASAPAFWWLGGAGLAVLALIAVAAAFRGVRWPTLVLGGYLAGLFPAMGFFDVYPFRYSYVADHFSYHAAWILLAAFAALLARLGAKAHLSVKAAMVGSTILLLLLSARTWLHAGDFVDRFALWTHVISKNPESWAATRGLALERIVFAERCEVAMREARAFNDPKAYDRALAEYRENLDEAEKLLVRVQQLRPGHEMTSYDLGRVYFMRGDLARAKEMFDRSAREQEASTTLRDGPYAGVYFAQGQIAQRQGDIGAAIGYFRKAIAAEHPPVQMPQVGPRIELLKLGVAEALRIRAAATRPVSTTGPGTRPATPVIPDWALTQGELVALARDVTEMAPENYEGWLYSGDLMMLLNRYPDAVVAYQQAARIGETTDAFVGFGKALASMGRFGDARLAFQTALQRETSRTDIRRLMDQAAEMERTTTRPAPANTTGTPPATPPSTAPAPPPATAPSPAR
jgi:tetratricopeptide (TPR) repeat protein